MIQEALEHHPEPLHISIDWEDQIAPQHRPVADWWHLVLGDTRDPQTFQKVAYIAELRRAGVIFIDTDHNYDQMKAELGLWGPLADEQTVWLFHDTWMYGPPNVEMTRAIVEYAAANGWVYDDYRKDSHGLGRMRK
jgi:cephalosporin hydroxylase